MEVMSGRFACDHLSAALYQYAFSAGVWVALINQSDCALFTKSFHRIKLTSRLFSFSPDLKDENVQLRDENQSLKNYIDRLLLGIISTSPEILEVKGESTTRRSRSLLGPLSTDY